VKDGPLSRVYLRREVPSKNKYRYTHTPRFAGSTIQLHDLSVLVPRGYSCNPSRRENDQAQKSIGRPQMATQPFLARFCSEQQPIIHSHQLYSQLQRIKIHRKKQMQDQSNKSTSIANKTCIPGKKQKTSILSYIENSKETLEVKLGIPTAKAHHSYH
jgi:hypothetical protein